MFDVCVPLMLLENRLWLISLDVLLVGGDQLTRLAFYVFQLEVCKEQLSKEQKLKTEALRQKECIQAMLQTKSSVSFSFIVYLLMLSNASDFSSSFSFWLRSLEALVNCDIGSRQIEFGMLEVAREEFGVSQRDGCPEIVSIRVVDMLVIFIILLNGILTITL